MLDVLPTLDMWNVMHGVTASVGFHLYLMAQPPDLPERMISAVPNEFFGHFLNAWSMNPDTIPAEVRASYLEASRNAVASIVADYRATATIDVEHDTADQKAGTQLRMPVAVLQQDWGAALGYRSDRTVARLGIGSEPHHGLLRTLHGRGGSGHRHQGTSHASRPVAHGSAPNVAAPDVTAMSVSR